ncbi:MAG: thioredoxin-disulfide reductase [Deltaproteobacteria bacterium]|nr:thioredoxin-disulfide reductase [Deltaproteobacteria bacterium]
MYDVIIIGAGPAGLTAGIYASRANLKTLLLGSSFNPSLITTTDIIENYPGFPDGISGFELVDKLTEQAQHFGLEIISHDVSSIEKISAEGSDAWEIWADQKNFQAYSLIFSTGAEYAKLDVPGEQALTGKGVSYCATCDGPFYREKDVVVVGGGDTAVQEALFLTKFARKVTLVHRRDRLRATGVLRERAEKNEKIAFVLNSEVEEILGDTVVSGVRLKDVNTPNSAKQLRADGVFIFAGYVPNTSLLTDIVEMDDKGYIITDDQMRTSVAGIFACGDCRQKLLRQVVTACGDGATAAFAAELYIDELKGTSYEGRTIDTK